MLLLYTHSDERVEVVNELLLDNAPGGVAVVAVPGLVKEDVWIVVVWLTKSVESRLHLLVLKQLLQMRVLDQLVDDTLVDKKIIKIFL